MANGKNCEGVRNFERKCPSINSSIPGFAFYCCNLVTVLTKHILSFINCFSTHMTTEVQHQPILPVDVRNKLIENKNNIPDPRLRSRMLMKENQMKRQMSSDLGIFTSNGINPPKKIRCVGNYDIGKTIGRGSFGKVKIATHVLTGEQVIFLKILFLYYKF